MRCDEASLLTVCENKDAARLPLTHHHRDERNEMNEMSVEKWWNEISGRGKREKPREKLIQIRFRPRSLHRVTETRTRDSSGGRRASNRLHHGEVTHV